MSDQEPQENKELRRWVALLTHAELPVLKQTARDLAALREDDKRLTAIAVAGVIARDPVLTVKLLRYLQRHKRLSQTTEVVLVEQALLMLGLEPFFNHVPASPLIEETLRTHAVALPPVLRVVHRSHRASEFAKDWAVRLRNLHYEEVRIAALLYDIAETLMWCFSPEQMLRIRDMQQQDKALRSRDAQREVLGFALYELQRELVTEWGLPQLLLILMNDAHANQTRVRNVTLAVNLARHSANGWDDAALPDDYRDIGELLRMPVEEVMVMLKTDAGIVCDLSKPH
ncbi:MAG: metal-dependent hydrolase [Gallionellales bacterium GWA2_60_18]|nr:MAG: metal-dependent hydrolase [Gallionellales bacterium GWA2_60_18]